MKTLSAITLIICVHALCIFFLVHKQNQIIKVKRDIQKHQSQIHALQEKIAEAHYKLSQLHTPEHVQKFAQEKLGMKPIILKEVKNYDA